jgi:DNA-binding XRE family transcriptional regulator
VASKVDWIAARAKWESNPKLTHEALALEIGVSKQAVGKRVNKEKWSRESVVKTTKMVVKNVVDNQPKTIKEKTTSTKALTKSIEPETTETGLVEGEQLHGNSKYKHEYNEQAYRLCLLGATDEEMAEFFHVTEQTVNNWKTDYPSFFASIKEGKITADAGMAESLYKRGRGYQYTEVRTKQELVNNDEDDSGIADGEMKIVEVTTTVKEMAPDTGAAFIWLKNRRPGNWRDKHDLTIHHKIDKDMMDRLATDMIERLERSRERQIQIDIERGITIDVIPDRVD